MPESDSFGSPFLDQSAKPLPWTKGGPNSQVIKGLEEKELIDRSPSSDGRAKNVSVTSNGSKILEKALPAVEQGDAKFFSTLDKEESVFLISIFQKLTTNSLTS